MSERRIECDHGKVFRLEREMQSAQVTGAASLLKI
jgi:hypothetical protein